MKCNNQKLVGSRSGIFFKVIHFPRLFVVAMSCFNPTCHIMSHESHYFYTTYMCSTRPTIFLLTSLAAAATASTIFFISYITISLEDRQIARSFFLFYLMK